MIEYVSSEHYCLAEVFVHDFCKLWSHCSHCKHNLHGYHGALWRMARPSSHEMTIIIDHDNNIYIDWHNGNVYYAIHSSRWVQLHETTKLFVAWKGIVKAQGVVTAIHTILTAKTEVQKFWQSLLLLDCMTALQNGSWPLTVLEIKQWPLTTRTFCPLIQ